MDSLDREGPERGVLRHVRDEVQAAFRVYQTVRMNEVVLRAVTGEGVITDSRLALVECCVEQPRNRGGRMNRLPSFRRRRFRLQDAREPIEKLAHSRRQNTLNLRKRTGDVRPERCSGEAFEQRAAEIYRAQLRQGQAGLGEGAERMRVELPVLPSVDDLVIERKPCELESLQVSPDRAGRDAGLAGQPVNRCEARGLDLAEDVPLSDNLGVSHSAAAILTVTYPVTPF